MRNPIAFLALLVISILSFVLLAFPVCAAEVITDESLKEYLLKETGYASTLESKEGAKDVAGSESASPNASLNADKASATSQASGPDEVIICDSLLALSDGNLNEVKRLLDHGCDVNMRHKILGGTPLMYVANYGKDDIVRLLISRGADLNIRNDYGTALVQAVMGKRASTVKILLDAGADPNIKGPAGSPLKLALMGNIKDVNIIRLFLDKGADPNSMNELGGLSVLDIAAFRANSETVYLLKSRGAKFNTAPKTVQEKYS